VTFRLDVSVDWNASPRIIEVAAPATDITILDLIETLRSLEDQIYNMKYPFLLAAEGRLQLDATATKYTGVIAILQNAQLRFEGRLGPTWVNCDVTDGILLSLDSDDAFQFPFDPQPYTNTTYEKEISPALIQTDTSGLTATEATYLGEIWKILGLDPDSTPSLHITPTLMEVDDGTSIQLTITKVGDDVTVQRTA
jgi:hypothetical protein